MLIKDYAEYIAQKYIMKDQSTFLPELEFIRANSYHILLLLVPMKTLNCQLDFDHNL